VNAQAPGFLCDPVLISIGVDHGFGERGGQPPGSTVFPEQVHGIKSFEAGSEAANTAGPKADVIVTRQPDQLIGIVTADCVPILVATRSGRAVGAIHAGWRGLSAGVIESGLAALRTMAGERELTAAVGPAARACCYEVDEPVRSALERDYSELLGDFLTPGRPNRFQLDLPMLAWRILIDCGVKRQRIGTQHAYCTICSGTRFESFRRDGSAAGRLKHFISPGGQRPVAPGEEG
jgi:YfiH family protein